jgi:hypothetical protein
MALLSRSILVGGFVAGALSVLVFHQGLVFLANQAGITSYAAYSWAPTPPFGVPQVLSSAFWGGLWGIVWALLATRLKGGRLGMAFLFGAILPPLVVVAIVLPLKGGDPRMFLQPGVLIFFLVLHGVWGFGTEVFLRLGRGRVW